MKRSFYLVVCLMLAAAMVLSFAACNKTDTPDTTTTVQQQGTTTVPDDGTTTEKPDDGTTVPDDGTTLPDDGTTTEKPEDTTTGPDDGTTTEKPEDTTTVPDDTTTEKPVDPPVPPTPADEYYEIIVNTAEGKFENVVEWNFAKGTVTFNAPKAGKYVIYSYDNEEVNFAAPGSEDYAKICVIEVAQAGDVTVNAQFFSWGTPAGGVVVYNYSVLRVEDVTITAQGGTLNLPANAVISVSFTAPEKGGYTVFANVENLAWNDTIDSKIYFRAEAGETVTFELLLSDVTAIDFDFAYTVVKESAITVVAGDNNVTLNKGQDKPFTFTADKAGSYLFSFANSNVYHSVYNEEYKFISCTYENSYVVDLAAGQTYEFYGTITAYAETEDVVNDVLNIKYVGQSIFSGENTLATDGNGIDVNFTAESETYYLFTAGTNALLGITDEAGNVSWVSSYEVKLAYGQTVAFAVKTADGAAAEVKVNVETVSYSFTLGIGKTTQTLVPGKEYTVSINGFSYGNVMVLNWNNANVTVNNNGENYVAGTEVSYYYMDMYITLNADAPADVEFELIDPTGVLTPEELFLGANAINVADPYNGKTATFTAPEAGKYVISAADGEVNAVVGSASMFGFEEFVLPYTVELSAGQTVSFVIMTANWSADTIDLVVTKEVEGEPITENEIVLGENRVEVLNGGKGIGAHFVAPETGKYVIEAADGETNAVLGIEGVDGITYVELPYEVELQKNEVVVMIVATANLEADVIDLVVGYAEEEDEGGLVLGENRVDVVNAFLGVTTTFTAPEAGKYEIKAADGETNAAIIIENAFGSENVDLPYTFELSAGETITLIVVTANWEADVIDLVVAVAAEEETNEIAVGSYYIMSMEQTNAGGTYYLTAEMSSYYIETTADKAKAEIVYVEATEGGYFFRIGYDKYINFVISGSYVNAVIEAAPSTVYTYNAELNTLSAIVNEKEYVLGTRSDKSYTTVGPVVAANYDPFIMTLELTDRVPEEPTVPDIPETAATLSFADKANRTTFTTEVQVWEQNGIKLTNNKAGSTSNVADYANPARFYKNSEVTIEYAGMTKIIVEANSTKYATALVDSIGTFEGATVTADGNTVTIELAAAMDSITLTLVAGQVRANSVTVY